MTEEHHQWHNYNIEVNEAAASVEIWLVGAWLNLCYSSIDDTVNNYILNIDKPKPLLSLSTHVRGLR